MEKVNRALLGQEFEGQSTGKKGRFFSARYEPLDRKIHLVTFQVKTRFPKVFPEICREQKRIQNKDDKFNGH